MEAWVFAFNHMRFGMFLLYFFVFCAHSYGQAAWNEANIEALLLPEDHPIKSSLDDLFSQHRATLDIKSMEKAQFHRPYPRKFTRLVVTSHPLLKGYILKLYLDAQRYYKKQTELTHWIRRIQGAQRIRDYIQANSLEHLFKVPQKWLYRLPEHPAPPKELLRKNYILICENMDILDREQNKKAWAEGLLPYDTLYQVYTLINELGLHDCASIDNIPFCSDGRIAFIDTETFEEWPVDFKKLTPYLSSDNQKLWKELIRND